MRLATLAIAGHTTAAVDLDGTWHALPFADVGAMLRHQDWRSEVETAPPVGGDPTLTTLITSPRKILCCGQNYSDHIAEMGREAPTYPTLFGKFADTLCGPFADITLDGRSDAVDWEAELVAVIGTPVYHADVDEARNAIVGYTMANDVSMRDWQNRTAQWLQGKAFDATTPLGPVLVTADEIDPENGLRITCAINDELVQDGNTATLVFSAAHLVSYISQFTQLLPGDLVLTGTPGGVGAARTPPRFLVHGDLLRTSIEGIGSMENHITKGVSV